MSKNSSCPAFDVTLCNRCDEAVSHIKKSLSDRSPYSLVFLDISFENDIDGAWAAEKIRQLDPYIEIVMVMEYSGYSTQEFLNRVPPADKMFFISKPVTKTQIIHFANSLACKWLNEQNFLRLLKSLEGTAQDRTKDIEEKNRLLQEQVSRYKNAVFALKSAIRKLGGKINEQTRAIAEKNTALEVLLDKRSEDKAKLGEIVIANARIMLTPIIEKMKGVSSISNLQLLVKILEMNVDKIISPFIGKISLGQYNLTYMETQVAHYVKIGISNKEMADILCISVGTILTHRHNLRKKLGITNKKINLRSHLISLE